eukprot:29333-Pelagococcus_subviridis.AAC.4
MNVTTFRPSFAAVGFGATRRRGMFGKYIVRPARISDSQNAGPDILARGRSDALTTTRARSDFGARKLKN